MKTESLKHAARAAGLLVAGAILGGVVMISSQAAPQFQGHLVSPQSRCIAGFKATKPNKQGIYSCVSQKLRCLSKAYDIQHPNGLTGGRYKYHCVPMNKF